MVLVVKVTLDSLQSQQAPVSKSTTSQ